MKVFNNVTFEIANSHGREKTILGPSPELLQLKVGQEIEIEFGEEGEAADYEIVDRKEKWQINDDGDETNTTIYTVKYITGSRRKL